MTEEADYGISPAQYRAGLGRLWQAMPDYKGPQDEDVFTLAARRLTERDRLKALNAELVEVLIECIWYVQSCIDDGSVTDKEGKKMLTKVHALASKASEGG